MPMRLPEVHPAVVHFPIALLPASIAADAIGVARRDRELLAFGKWAIVAAAASAAVAGVFGLIAQEEVNVEGDARDVLVTHRTLNVAALGVMTALAVARVATRRPKLGYLLAGLGAIGAVTYSAYLGGKLVYLHGAGVEKAGGLYGEAPELTGRNAGHAVAVAARHLGQGLVHTARDVARGELAPTLTSKRSNGHRGRTG